MATRFMMNDRVSSDSYVVKLDFGGVGYIVVRCV